MRAKPDKQSEPEKDQPKLEKELLRDLDLDPSDAEGVKGGWFYFGTGNVKRVSEYCNAAGGGVGRGEGS